MARDSLPVPIRLGDPALGVSPPVWALRWKNPPAAGLPEQSVHVEQDVEPRVFVGQVPEAPPGIPARSPEDRTGRWFPRAWSWLHVRSPREGHLRAPGPVGARIDRDAFGLVQVLGGASFPVVSGPEAGYIERVAPARLQEVDRFPTGNWIPVGTCRTPEVPGLVGEPGIAEAPGTAVVLGTVEAPGTAEEPDLVAEPGIAEALDIAAGIRPLRIGNSGELAGTGVVPGEGTHRSTGECLPGREIRSSTVPDRSARKRNPEFLEPSPVPATLRVWSPG
jgi:hypothetical protein